MATNYSSTQLDGTGSLLTGKTLNATTGYTLNFTCPTSGSSYITMQTVQHVAGLPAYFSGSNATFSGYTGSYTADQTKIGFVVESPSGVITFTPAVNIDGDNVYINATGGVSVNASW